jgi:hypothetical protein
MKASITILAAALVVALAGCGGGAPITSHGEVIVFASPFNGQNVQTPIPTSRAAARSP